ncbi:MAG: HAMP domain-containing histidine kinase [Bacilli bacterium]|nr:HAMP domain-containing histidine kinase [Bacilli bacterium]
MNNIENVVLNLTLALTPILMYLLYSAYSKITNKKESKLLFTLTLITQMYLLVRFSPKVYKGTYFLIDLPLIISYYKKDEKLILLLSIFLMIIQMPNINIAFLITKYLTVFLISKTLNDKLIISFSIFKLLELYTYKLDVYTLISLSILLYLISSVIIYILKRGENITNIHIQIKELEKEEKIKKSLFQITHEIKNPIAVCKGYLDMYDEKKDFNKYIPILKEEIDRTLILLEDFLSMNRQKIKKDILDINMLLEEVVDNMEMLIKNEKIDLKADIDEDEIYVNGDYNRLTQVLINIIKNSIEALNNRKSPTIKIWTKTEDKYINIYVEDNGEGIKREVMEKIKEPFYTTKLKGTGLGVSLSDEIIKSHRGSLDYSSEEGKYTKVKIKLPLESI